MCQPIETCEPHRVSFEKLARESIDPRAEGNAMTKELSVTAKDLPLRITLVIGPNERKSYIVRGTKQNRLVMNKPDEKESSEVVTQR